MSKPNWKNFEHFKYKNLDLLKQAFQDLELKVPFSTNTNCLKTLIYKNGIFIPNRLSIQPMEAVDANEQGGPSELTKRRYLRYAKSGAGLIWFEATSILEESKSNPNQFTINNSNVKNFRELVEEIKELGTKTLEKIGFEKRPILILQLNHSGRYSKRGHKRTPFRTYENEELDRAIGINSEESSILTDNELKNIENIWVEKSILAKEAGFDGVDIKSCHGYLINDLLCSRSRSNSDYGGPSLKNRSKLLIDIISKLRKKYPTNNDFIITTRLGVYDGIPYPNGFGVREDEEGIIPPLIDLKEPLQLIKMLYDRGVHLINITMGNPYYMPHITRPFNQPGNSSNIPDEHPLFGAYRHYKTVHDIKEQSPSGIIIVGSAYSYLQQFAGYVAAGLVENNWVDICGFGRMAFANPNFPIQIYKEGKIDSKRTCITCSQCTELKKAGRSTGCALRDKEFYAPISNSQKN